MASIRIKIYPNWDSIAEGVLNIMLPDLGHFVSPMGEQGFNGDKGISRFDRMVDNNPCEH